MLQFIADVNIEKNLVDLIRKMGYDVLWIPDYNCRLNDNEVLKLANKENRVLITNDKDFGELVFNQRKVTTGIILLRFKGQDIKKKTKSLHKLLKFYAEKIAGNFVVVSYKKIRFKPLEDIR